MKTLILVSGWRNSGNDTTADFISKTFDFKKVSFAAPLKDMVAIQYGIPRESLDDRVLKESPLMQYPILDKDGFSENIHQYMTKEHRVVHGIAYHTPRSLAILEGSVKRSVDPDYWVNKAMMALGEKSVIADWRYPSEFDGASKYFDGKIVTLRINRFDSCESVDPSERALDDFSFDHVIENRGLLIQLEAKIEDIVSLYL